MQKLRSKRIRIPVRDQGNLLKVCGSLPYNPTIELGGYITPSSIYYTEGNRENVPVLGSHRVVFHTHPVKDRADIPSELDILNLIFLNWETSILLTPHRLIVLSKTAATKAVLQNLERVHDRHILDVATLLRSKGPDRVFYYLIRKLVRSHARRFNLSHRNWEHRWEAFVRQELRLDLKVWDCVPLSCAA